MCVFYDELDAILGTRAASEPQVVLENTTGVTPRPSVGGEIEACAVKLFLCNGCT